MEQLDGIVTAVSEILLVFEEAQKDFSTNLKVESKNLQTLINSIQQMVQDNKELLPQIDDQQLRTKMNQTFIDTTEASDRLEKLIKAQHNGIIARSAYRQMHEELSVILHNMIVQIQVTDQCNIKIIMTCAKKNLDCLSRMSKVDSVGGLEAVARDLKKLQEALDVYLKTRIAETTDFELNQRLSNASDRYMVGTPKSIDSSRKHLESPSASSKTTRDADLKNIVEALQEIITTVIATAEFINQFALQFALPPAQRRPEEAGQRPRVDEELTRVENAVRRGDGKEANAACQSLDREVAKQAEEGRNLAKNMKDEDDKKDLLKDVATLEKLVPQISESANKVINSPNDDREKEKFARLISDARKANQNIENAKKPEHKLVQGANGLNDAVKRLTDAVERGDKAAAERALKEVEDRIRRQVAAARALAEKMVDPRLKKEVLDGADELEKLGPVLAKATHDTLLNPNDKDARKRFNDATKGVVEQNDRITRAALEDQLQINNKDLRGKIDDLYDAVAKGDSTKSASLLRDIDDLVKRRIELGNELANHVHDPKLKNQILSACDVLAKDLPELHSAANASLKNPNDAKASERLYRVGEEMKDAADRVTGQRLFGDKLPEMILSNGRDLDESIERLRDAIRRGDAAAAAAAARDIANQIAKQVALGRRLAEMCGPEEQALKNKLLNACDELEKLSPLIVQETKNCIMNPNDKEAQKRLDGLLDSAKGHNKTITDAAEYFKNKRDGKLPVKATAPPKQPVQKVQKSETRADGSKDEIMIAAHSVDKALREVHAPMIPEQKELLEIARLIAEEMEKLSVAAQTNDKTAMIQSARKIADLIQKVQSLSTQIAEKCTDPKNKQRLLNICRVPKNFAVQLKIISAVKAASGSDDKAAEAQLVTCAKSLADAVVQTVKAADAASLSAK